MNNLIKPRLKFKRDMIRLIEMEEWNFGYSPSDDPFYDDLWKRTNEAYNEFIVSDASFHHFIDKIFFGSKSSPSSKTLRKLDFLNV